jgi:Tfp pilus assembly protein FimT
MQSIQIQPRRANRRTNSRARHRDTGFRHRCAFSILELVIVGLVMSILAAVAAPVFYDSLLFHRVELAARRVKADLELTRTQARLTSSTRFIKFVNSTYTLTNTTNLDHPGAAYTVNLAKQPFVLDSATASFAGSSIVSFNGYGAPSSAGTVVLTAKSHQCAVTLNGVTGDVTITSNHSGGRTAQVSGS